MPCSPMRHPCWPSPRSSIGAAFTLSALGWSVFACGGDVVAPKPAPDPSHLYWALTLDHHAITLSTVAPYDTLQLVPTARAATGDPLPFAGAVIYTTSDPLSVEVSANGQLRAGAAGNGFRVTARLTTGDGTQEIGRAPA